MEYLYEDQLEYTDVYHDNLRGYILQVYAYMIGALLLTGLCAMLVVTTPLMEMLYITQDGTTTFSLIGWGVACAPIVVALTFSVGLPKMSIFLAHILFWGYSSLLGLSLSSIVLLYTGENIANVFFINAILFSWMGFYGYITRKDLTSFASFVIMGILGAVMVIVSNIIFGWSEFNTSFSVVSILMLIGLLAFNTQAIADIHDYMYETVNRKTAIKHSIMGALLLYLDVINIFVHLFQLLIKKNK